MATFFLAIAGAPALSSQKETAPAEKPKNTSQNRGQPSPEQAAKSEPKREVALTGHVSPATSGPGEEARFWITIENDSASPLKEVGIEHLDANGFQLIRRCWSDDAANYACRAAGESSPNLPVSCAAKVDLLCAEIPPRQSVTIWGDLRRLYKSPKQDAFAVVHWTRDGFSSRGIVPLGPLESLGWLRSKWSAVTQDWELGFPFWLAVFSGLYALRQSRRERWQHQMDVDREEASKREQTARGEAERKAAQEFDQQGKTWNLLLGELQRLSISHYMSIASTLQGVLQYLKMLQDAKFQTADNYLAAFCYLIRFHWRVREMKRGGASWQFKSLTAEELVVELFQAYRVKFDLVDLQRQAALDTFLQGIEEKSTIADLVTKVKECKGVQKRFWKEFKTWSVGPEAQESVLLLSALLKVINFETNRPYMYWYEERRPIPLEPDEKLKIEEVAANPLLTDAGMAKRVAEYLAEAGKYVKIKH